jgi:hypothetical protein
LDDVDLYFNEERPHQGIENRNGIVMRYFLPSIETAAALILVARPVHFGEYQIPDVPGWF